MEDLPNVITIIEDSIKQVFELNEITFTTLAIVIIALLVVIVIKEKK